MKKAWGSVFLTLVFCQWAQGAELVTTLGMTFVSIQAGSFIMGSPEYETYRFDYEILHNVTLTKSFEMQTTAVTQRQWVNVMGYNPSFFQQKKNCPNSYQATPVSMCPNHPVEMISLNDAQLFISKLQGLLHDRYTYGLPTEAQWEYAARAGTKTAYYFNSNLIDQFAWHSKNSDRQSQDVGQLKPNAYGLYDMSGNVYQWIQDWYGDYQGSQTD